VVIKEQVLQKQTIEEVKAASLEGSSGMDVRGTRGQHKKVNGIGRACRGQRNGSCRRNGGQHGWWRCWIMKQRWQRSKKGGDMEQA
jgi:hypothetical protein